MQQETIYVHVINTPPYLTQALVNQNVYLGNTQTYSLPPGIDPEGNLVTVSVPGPLPTTVRFDGYSTFIFYGGQASGGTSAAIAFTLFDGAVYSTVYTLMVNFIVVPVQTGKLSLLNTGPPYFLSPLTSTLILTADEPYSLILPPY